MKTRNRTIRIGVSGVVLALAVAACDNQAADPPPPPPPPDEQAEQPAEPQEPEDPVEEPTPDPDPAEQQDGTVLALGETATVGDWEVAVTDVDADANQAIADENEFNDPPEEGQYVVAYVEATYNGAEQGTAWLDLSYRLYGSDGRVYSTSYAVAPNEIGEEPDVTAGGSVAGGIVFDVPPEALDDATIAIEDTWSMADTRAHWAIP